MNSQENVKEKPYQLVIDYVRGEILHGNLVPGDRLPGERELAEQLGISRNSVREGLRILENMGVTSSQHGAGHYISLNFDEPMTETLSLIYTMKGMGRDDLTQFRYCLEREAMHLAVDYASEQQKIIIGKHLEALLRAETEKDRYEHDMALHMTLIEASRNDYLITTYRALTNVIEDYIPVLRGREDHRGDEEQSQARGHAPHACDGRDQQRPAHGSGRPEPPFRIYQTIQRFAVKWLQNDSP